MPRTFKVGSEVYDIPEEEVTNFLKDNPKATEVQSFIMGKDTFDIPLPEVNSFLTEMPEAKPLKKKESTVSSDIQFKSQEEYNKSFLSPASPEKKKAQLDWIDKNQNGGAIILDPENTGINEVKIIPPKPKVDRLTSTELAQLDKQFVQTLYGKPEPYDLKVKPQGQTEGERNAQVRREQASLQAQVAVMESQMPKDVPIASGGVPVYDPKRKQLERQIQEKKEQLKTITEPQDLYDRIPGSQNYDKDAVKGYLNNLEISSPEAYKTLSKRAENGQMTENDYVTQIVAPALRNQMEILGQDLDILKERGMYDKASEVTTLSKDLQDITAKIDSGEGDYQQLISEFKAKDARLKELSQDPGVGQVLDVIAKQQDIYNSYSRSILDLGKSVGIIGEDLTPEVEQNIYDKLDSENRGYLGGSIKALHNSVAGVLDDFDKLGKFAAVHTGIGDLLLDKGYEKRQGLLGQIANQVREDGNSFKDMPKTWWGTVGETAIGMTGLIAEMAMFPEIRVAKLAKATGGVVRAIPAFTTMEATMGAVREWDQLVGAENPEKFDIALETLKAGGEGAAMGTGLHFLGAFGGETGKFISKYVKGNSIPAVSSFAATGTAFGTLDAFEQYMQTGEVDLGQASAVGLGASILAGPQVMKALASDAYGKAKQHYYSASKELTDKAMLVEKPEELLREAVELRKEGKENEANVLNTMANIKLVTDEVVKDPERFKKEVNESNLTDKEKSYYLTKIDETVKTATELRKTEDVAIADNQKRLGLPTEVAVPISDNTGETLLKIEAGEPVVNARLKEASSDLYSRYKGLLSERNSHARKHTTEQLDKAIEDIGGKIESLENMLQKQGETGEFLGIIKPGKNETPEMAGQSDAQPPDVGQGKVKEVVAEKDVPEGAEVVAKETVKENLTVEPTVAEKAQVETNQEVTNQEVANEVPPVVEQTTADGQGETPAVSINEQQPTNDIEAKKAEIEKRRQDEIYSYKQLDSSLKNNIENLIGENVDITVKENNGGIKIFIKNSNGKNIFTVTFNKTDGNVYEPGILETNENYRRRGIASKVYETTNNYLDINKKGTIKSKETNFVTIRGGVNIKNAGSMWDGMINKGIAKKEGDSYEMTSNINAKYDAELVALDANTPSGTKVPETPVTIPEKVQDMSQIKDKNATESPNTQPNETKTKTQAQTGQAEVLSETGNGGETSAPAVSNLYEMRKTTGGWSVDKNEFGNWTFVAKFGTKKEAQEYINSKTEKESAPAVSDLSAFEDVVKSSASPKEAFDKANKIKGIPEELSKEFRDKYDPDKKLTPFQAFEKFYNEVKGKQGKVIEPNKEISASKSAAIKDVLTISSHKDMKEMEAGMLLNEAKDKDLDKMMSDYEADDFQQMEVSGDMKLQMFKKLEEKGYVEDFGGDTYTLTPKGRDFIEKVNARLETRKAVKAGTDLFPEYSGIPEVEKKLKEITDGHPETRPETVRTFAGKTEGESKQLEPVVKALEGKATIAGSLKKEAIEKAIEEIDKIVELEVMAKSKRRLHNKDFPELISTPALESHNNTAIGWINEYVETLSGTSVSDNRTKISGITNGAARIEGIKGTSVEFQFYNPDTKTTTRQTLTFKTGESANKAIDKVYELQSERLSNSKAKIEPKIEIKTEPEYNTIPDLQEALQARKITQSEYNKRVEELRNSRQPEEVVSDIRDSQIENVQPKNKSIENEQAKSVNIRGKEWNPTGRVNERNGDIEYANGKESMWVTKGVATKQGFVHGATPNPVNSATPAGIQPSPLSGGKPQRWTTMLQTLNKSLSKAGLFGRVDFGGKKRGTYDASSGAISVKYASDIPAITHEIGHRIDDKYNILKDVQDGKLDHELSNFWVTGSLPPKGHPNPMKYQRAEGLAEFLRAYMINPNEARKQAPGIYALYETVPQKVRDAMEVYSKGLREWWDMPANQKAEYNKTDHAQTEPFWEKALAPFVRQGEFKVNWWSKAKEGVHSQYSIINKAWDAMLEMKGIENVLPSKDFMKRSRLLLGDKRKFQVVLDEGMIDVEGNILVDTKTGKSKTWNWLFEPYHDNAVNYDQVVSNKKYAENVMMNKRAIELVGKKEYEQIENDLKDIKGRIPSPVLLAKYPKLQAKYQKEIDAFMQDAINNSRQSKDMYHEDSRYDFTKDVLTGFGAGMVSDFQMAETVVKEFEALQVSDKARYDMVNESTRRYQEMSNDVMQYMLDSGRITKDAFDYIKEANQHYVAMKVVKSIDSGIHMESDGKGKTGEITSIDKNIIKKYEGSGWEKVDPYVSLMETMDRAIKESDRNSALATFVEPLRSSRGMHEGEVEFLADIAKLEERAVPGATITVYNKGVAEHWRLNKDLYDAITTMNDQSLPGWVRGITTPMRVLRQTVTTFPVFQAKNRVRDFDSRLVVGQGSVSYKDFQNRKQAKHDLEITGGGQFGYYFQNKVNYFDYMEKGMKQMVKEGHSILNPAKLVGKTWDAYMNTLGNSELQSRAEEYNSVYRRAKKEGMSDFDARIEAAFAARDLLDFGVAGKWMKILNAFAPFTNARYRGFDKFVSSIRTNPIRTLAKFGMYVAIPEAVHALIIAQSDEDTQKRYYQLPSWRRDLAWNIPLGDGWVPIPKPFELGLLSSLFRRVYDYLAGDEQALSPEVLKFFFENMLPINPTLLQGINPVSDMMYGYDSFRDRDVVPYWEKNVKISEREGTVRATRLGKALQTISFDLYDARSWDFAIKTIFTYPGNWALKLSDIGREDKESKVNAEMTGFYTKDQPQYSRDVAWVLDNVKKFNINVIRRVETHAKAKDIKYLKEMQDFKDLAAAYWKVEGKDRELIEKAMVDEAIRLREQYGNKDISADMKKYKEIKGKMSPDKSDETEERKLKDIMKKYVH